MNLFQSFIILLKRVLSEVRTLFELRIDTDEAGTVESINKNIEFRGGNLWALGFAILIASIGLNVNSTAVIIGAMLISPLMGPIVGAGFAIGTNDLDLLKKSARNLLVAVILSLIVSSVYFMISPLKIMQSELLARTTPTIYDVLIALFGGATGIVAGSRKDKSNAIPGVAIATALMPPLCTAGFGIATGDLSTFLGAAYLFTINSVLICLATFLFVRNLKFKQKEFLDQARARKVTRVITIVTILTIVPSIWVAYNVVREGLFKARVAEFIQTEIEVLPESEVLKYEAKFQGDSSVIDIVLVGKKLLKEEIDALKRDLNETKLKGAYLNIMYPGSDQAEMEEQMAAFGQTIKTEMIERLYKDNQGKIEDQADQIKFLEEELIKEKERNTLPIQQLLKEIKALDASIQSMSLGRQLELNSEGVMDTFVLASIGRIPNRDLSKEEQKILGDWLSARLNVKARVRD